MALSKSSTGVKLEPTVAPDISRWTEVDYTARLQIKLTGVIDSTYALRRLPCHDAHFA